MRRVDDDRQVRDPLNRRYDRQVKRISRMSRKGPDAAFTENDVVIALGHYVLGRKQKLLERGRQSAFEQHGLAGLADILEQRKVLHIAGTDLDAVAIFLDSVDPVLVHRLGDDIKPELIADLGHHLQALFAESLKSVRRSTRLVRTAAEESGAAFGDDPGGRYHLFAVLKSARAGDHREFAAADGRITDLYDRPFGTKIFGDQFVRLGDADRLGDAGQIFKMSGVDRTAVAGDADRGPVRAGQRMPAKTECVDRL